jgi:hypothetical protein
VTFHPASKQASHSRRPLVVSTNFQLTRFPMSTAQPAAKAFSACYSSCLCATMIATARLDLLARSSASASNPDGTCRTTPSIQSRLETNPSRLNLLFDKLEEEYKANDPLVKTTCHPLVKGLRVGASTSLRHCMEVDQADMSEPLVHSRRSSTTLVAPESDDEATRTGALSAFDGVGSLAQYGADSIEGEGLSPEHSTFAFSSSDLAELGVRWAGRGGKSLDEPSEHQSQSRHNDAEEARRQSADWMFEEIEL